MVLALSALRGLSNVRQEAGGRSRQRNVVINYD